MATRGTYIRNTTLEILGIFLAMALAGSLDKYLSQTLILPISHNLTRIVTGILIGGMVGACVGLLVKHTYDRLIKS